MQYVIRPSIRSLTIAGLLAGFIAALTAAGPASKPSTAKPGTRPATAPSGPPIDYNRDIRPILSDNCFACHGPDKNKRKAKLRLDDRDDGAGEEGDRPRQAGRERAGRAGSSRDDPDELMPPPESHKTLTAAQKELLKRWVAAGGRVPAALGLRRRRSARPVPPVEGRGVGPQPDRRVHPRTSSKRRSSRPSPEADRRTLLRRLSLDLIGLPPTPEEVRRVRATTRSPDAYEKAGRPAARLAALRRADGRALARPGAVRRHGRLPRRPEPATSSRTATTSSTRSTATSRSTSSRSSSSPATCCRTRRPSSSSPPASTG